METTYVDSAEQTPSVAWKLITKIQKSDYGMSGYNSHNSLQLFVFLLSIK